MEYGQRQIWAELAAEVAVRTLQEFQLRQSDFALHVLGLLVSDVATQKETRMHFPCIAWLEAEAWRGHGILNRFLMLYT